MAGVGGEDEGRPWAAKEPPEPVGTTVGFRQRPVGTLALQKEHWLLPGGLGGEEGSQEASWGLSESEGSGGDLAVTGDTWFYVPVPRKGLGGWGGIDGGLRAGAPFPQGSGEGGEQGLGVLFFSGSRSCSPGPRGGLCWGTEETHRRRWGWALGFF